jgi:hypothetical protein
MSCPALELHIAGDVGLDAIAGFFGCQSPDLASGRTSIGPMRVFCGSIRKQDPFGTEYSTIHRPHPAYAALHWRWTLRIESTYAWWEIREALAFSLCHALFEQGAVAVLGVLDTGKAAFFAERANLRVPEDSREYFTTPAHGFAEIDFGDIPELEQ